MEEYKELFKSLAVISTVSLVVIAIVAATYLYLIWPLIPVFY